MEVQARYTLMGLFALAVLGAGLAFAYWLETGGLGQRVVYHIRYGGPVAGLAKGSSVLFNGVRIGEVTALHLETANPSGVAVDIAVDRAAPIRQNTVAGIDFQGLAGAPAVSLVGGTHGRPLLAEAVPSARVLQADPNAGQSVTQFARDVLRAIDTVVTENAVPLKSAIVNIDKFTGALARNSDKIDSIMAGLERLTGSAAKPRQRVVELQPASVFPRMPALPAGQLQIPEPTALANLQTDKIFVAGDASGQLEASLWADALPHVVQVALTRSFENVGYKRILGRAPDNVKIDNQLLLDIRRFQIEKSATSRAEIEIGARILKADGNLSQVKVFRAVAPVNGSESQEAMVALARAFDSIAVDLVVWTCASLG